MYSINGTNEKSNIRHKLTAWLLIMCLVVTLIPDIGFAANAAEMHESNEKTVQQPSEMNVEKKTADTTTYDLGGGKHMTVFHGGQVRYKTETGKLQDYDPSLVRIKKGSKTGNNVSLENYVYENKKGDKKQYLPETLSEDTPIIMENDDCSVSFTPSNDTLEKLKAEDASPQIKKEKTETLYESEKTVPISAVYKSEDKNAEIKYTSGDSGIKETITLNEKPESNVFTYIFELENMTARKNPTNEGITFYDLSGEDIKGAIEAPWMNDASGKAYSEDITYDIEKLEGEKNRYLLTMTVDKDYLESKDREYPVTIDPTTTWKGNDKLRDVYVISGSKYGDENFYAEGTNVMPAGKNSTGTHRTYIKFIDLKATVLGKSVTSAKLTVYEKGDGNTGQKVSAYKVKKS